MPPKIAATDRETVSHGTTQPCRECFTQHSTAYPDRARRASSAAHPDQASQPHPEAAQPAARGLPAPNKKAPASIRASGAVFSGVTARVCVRVAQPVRIRVAARVAQGASELFGESLNLCARVVLRVAARVATESLGGFAESFDAAQDKPYQPYTESLSPPAPFRSCRHPARTALRCPRRMRCFRPA